jgi:hypothetical protein
MYQLYVETYWCSMENTSHLLLLQSYFNITVNNTGSYNVGTH